MRRVTAAAKARIQERVDEEEQQGDSEDRDAQTYFVAGRRPCRVIVLHGGWLEDGGVHAWVDGKDAGLASCAPATPARFSRRYRVLIYGSASGDLVMTARCLFDSACTRTNDQFNTPTIQTKINIGLSLNSKCVMHKHPNT